MPRSFPNALSKWFPLRNDPQWSTCTDGGHTPWRYRIAEPGDNEDWMDVSRYQPHPSVEYDKPGRSELVVGTFKKIKSTMTMQENDLDKEDYAGGTVDLVEVNMPYHRNGTDGAVYDELKASIVEDDGTLSIVDDESSFDDSDAASIGASSRVLCPQCLASLHFKIVASTVVLSTVIP